MKMMVLTLVKQIIYIVIFFIYIFYMGRKLNKKTLRKKNSISRKNNKSRKNNRSRKNKRTFKGGGSPSPFQGTAWSHNNLPGMSINPNGGSNANFYSLNNYNRTPMQYMSNENPLVGGGKRRRSKQNRKSIKSRKSRKQKKRNQKGGFVTDLINAGRYVEYEGGTFKNEINGYDRPVNPLPWADQYRTNSFSNFSSIK